MASVAAPPLPTNLASVEPLRPSPLQLASATTAAPVTTSEPPTSKRVRSSNNVSPRSSNDGSSPIDQAQQPSKPSPPRNGVLPAVMVKKEPGSPSLSTPSRPRPKRLDLSSSTTHSRGPQTARPLTSRDSAGLAIQDVGLACLSPGFQTNDPSMREQLQRSLDVRDQQRQIIEARQKGSKPGASHDTDMSSRTQDTTLFGVQTRGPATSRRKGPPPPLSIAAPAASQFANDRVIQSAPLHQTFTGLRPGDQIHTRHVQHGPSGLSQTSHIHHVPATQTSNRLPPIADVFANDQLYPSHPSPSHGTLPPPAPSPGFPPGHPYAATPGSQAREFRSADEAVQGLSGGREDLMPKVVHYGGVQPPTPPSPMPQSNSNGSSYHSQFHPPLPLSASAGAQVSHGVPPPPAPSRPDHASRIPSMNGRRRDREEYERDNGSPPSSSSARHYHVPAAHSQQDPKRPAYAVRGEFDQPRSDMREAERDGFESDWRQNLTGPEKKAEFLRLCDRAWDLFHS